MNEQYVSRYSNCYTSSQERFEKFFTDAEQTRDLGLCFRWNLPRDALQCAGLPLTGDRVTDYVVGKIVAEALAAAPTGRAVSFSLRKGWWAGKQAIGGAGYTYAYVRKAVVALADDGLLDVSKGVAIPGGTGVQSTFSATPRLLDRFGQAVPHYALHDPILLRDSGGNLMPIPDTRRLDRLRKSLAARNEAIASVDIKLDAPDIEWTDNLPILIDGRWYDPRRKAAHIVYNGDLDHGGRLYGLPYQTLSQRQHGRRDQLTIGGDPVEEPDFGGCHPRMLHHLAGSDPDGDLYDAQSAYGREGNKVGVQVMLNASSEREAISAFSWKMARQEAQDAQEAGGAKWTQDEIDARARRHMAPSRDMFDALRDKHQPIADQFFTGVGSRLQTIETAIMTSAAMACLRQGVVVLPMHDSAITKAGRDAGILRQEMHAAYHAKLGFKPVISAH